LKVGPELTFALREALFLLEHMEHELSSLIAGELSGLRGVVEEAMLEDPRHWQKYYSGDSRERALARKYSYSDRIRYYWNQPQVRAAVARLFSNVGQIAIPPPLVSQFFSHATDCGAPTVGTVTPEWLVRTHINRVLRRYYQAAGFPLAVDCV
jgi:D-tagatose-1,6-bisphosphate aldolase subunit GatZ/KbaZ